MFESNWIIKKEEKFGLELFERIKCSRIDAYKRGECEGLACLNDPFLINEMSVAVDCIMDHINKGSKICIHGDYDCDGVTSAYIVFDYLKSIGANVEWFIPDRFDDGYGISLAKAKSFSAEMVSLVITTDCGVTAMDEVDIIRNQGIDVIVTDHHQVKQSLPNANAVLCNSRIDNKYPYPYLSGSGMALKLVQALSKTLGSNDAYIKYIGICAIGTISDIVPLTGENKVLAGYGLELIKSNASPGLRAIIENAAIEKDKINAYTIGFIIGPRINAAGRMGNAALAFELLDEKDFGIALKKAAELSRLNELRKTEQEKAFNELKDYIFENGELLDSPILFLCREDIHKGILGIVASKLVDLFRKPVFVLKEENGICEGSGRSVEGFSLIKILNKANDFLLGFGGHDMAAGLRMKCNAVSELLRHFKDIYSDRKTFKKEVRIDTLCSLDEIDAGIIKKIDELGPFGAGNMIPIIAVENVYITGRKEMGKSGNHLSFDIIKEGRALRCVAFNAASYKHLIVEGQKYNIA
ncbi:MAG: single-stranded-DNA-specific exonuclease RecJ, partial [Clostridia bacterium]|nr:single-stranded-DNA-specific exonuclease RecJ [Clostridia bacterium]